MKTRVDDAIARFMSIMIETDDISEQLQELLNCVREQYGFDVVYILERVKGSNIFTYKYASVSKPQYDNRGVHIQLKEEDYENALHMYDDSPICGFNVDSAMDYEVSDCIIHYGFVRKKMHSYDGSIGFQLFTPHTWTEEEKAVLMKLGKLCKMIFSVLLSEGVNEHLYAALEQERKQYRDALAESSEYSFSFDISEGLIREKIVTAHNKNLITSLGLSLPVNYDKFHETFLEKNKIRLLEENMAGCFSCAGLVEQFEKGISNPEAEYYNPTDDIYMRVSVHMYQDKETGHIHGLFLATDITEAKKKQEEQQQALLSAYEAANHASAAKSNFLANMSHDIRTPMNGIIGMTAIAGTHLDDKERVADCLSKIMSASKHLLGLLNEVLDMSKIESGKIELQNEAFSLPDLVDDLVTMVKPQIEAKHHEFSVSIKDIEHEKVIGDSQRIQQVFLNLLSNAIKYTPDGGKIEFILSEQPFHRKNVGCYQVVIEDNGIGMSKEFLERLFEPFTRAEDCRVAQIQGTGLGMAITRNIVQLMNGRIDVKSKPDQGTKFTVTIFLNLQEDEEHLLKDILENEKQPQNLSALKEVQKNNFSGKRALLVEDNELNAEIAGEILGMTGLEITYAKDGKEAFDKIAEAEAGYYDIVFMDIQMPIMDGYEATQAIRSLPDAYPQRVPIIAMTANAFMGDIQACKAAGMDEHIAKPLEFDRLFKVLNRWLG